MFFCFCFCFLFCFVFVFVFLVCLFCFVFFFFDFVCLFVCFILFPWLSKKLSQLPNLELDSLLSRFYGLVRTKKILWMGYIKQMLAALLFEEWKKIIVPSVKFNLGLLFNLAHQASVNSKPRLNFTSGTVIFHPFQLWADNIKYCILYALVWGAYSY